MNEGKKELLDMGIRDKMKMLIEGDVSAYKIEKYTGLPTGKISRIRTGKANLGNLSESSIESLERAFYHFYGVDVEKLVTPNRAKQEMADRMLLNPLNDISIVSDLVKTEKVKEDFERNIRDDEDLKFIQNSINGSLSRQGINKTYKDFSTIYRFKTFSDLGRFLGLWYTEGCPGMDGRARRAMEDKITGYVHMNNNHSDFSYFVGDFDLEGEKDVFSKNLLGINNSREFFLKKFIYDNYDHRENINLKRVEMITKIYEDNKGKPFF